MAYRYVNDQVANYGFDAEALGQFRRVVYESYAHEPISDREITIKHGQFFSACVDVLLRN